MDKPALRRTDRMLRSTSSSPACPERRRRDPLSGVVPTGTKTDRPFGPLRSRRQDGHLNERLPPLKIEPAEIPDVLLVTPHVFKDDRGFFMETWHERKFREQGLDLRFVQDNHSKSRRGTLRGLHFQNPHPQGKLVRVVVGAVYDVAVDIRRGSPTFAKWVGAELSGEQAFALCPARIRARILRPQRRRRVRLQVRRLLRARARARHHLERSSNRDPVADRRPHPFRERRRLPDIG